MSKSLHSQSLNPASLNSPVDDLSRWQRMWQYQPTSNLVKIIFAWWLVVVMVSAIKLGKYFGLSTKLVELILLGCMLVFVGLLFIVLLDVVLLRAISQAKSYHIARNHPNNVAIFHPVNIEVLLSYQPSSLKLVRLFGIRHIQLEFYDHYPNHVQLTNCQMPISLSLDIASAEQKQIMYSATPIQRGTEYFNQADLRVTSPFSLFHRRLHIPNSHSQQPLKVLADFTGLLSNELSAMFEKSYDAGIQTLKEQGQGSEFLKLKEYAVGDSIRQIDWKASSRQRRLMSKSYEDENDQDVVFLLDCGEQMRHKASLDEQDEDGVNNALTAKQFNYFDKVLNAILLLSYVANKQGDRVGLLSFGGVDKFIAPKKGASLIRHLLKETADITPVMQTTDYMIAAQKLNKSINKRSLVVVITNTRQEASDELIQAMQTLSRKHQLVFANLTEQSVQDVLEQSTLPISFDDALLYHSLVSYQQMRDRLHKTLSQQTGAMCLSTTANRLPMVLTQAYMALK